MQRKFSMYWELLLDLKSSNHVMLRWEDIREMSKHNISFGAHTVNSSGAFENSLSLSELKPEIEAPGSE